jgi:hypothetical protein
MILPWRPTFGGRTASANGRSWRRARSGRYSGGMEQREEPVTMATATDEQRAQAREEFRRKLAEAEARMTPEKRDKVREAFGLDTRAA